MISWAGVQRDDIPHAWPHVALMLKRAVDKTHGEYSLTDIRGFLEAGDMQLWVIHDKEPLAACVTQIKIYPRKRVCLIVLLAGKAMKSWRHLLGDVIRPWARERGCSGFEAWCTPGMARMLKDWVKQYVVMGARI